MAVSKRLRFEVLRRDDYTCRYCGAHAGEDEVALTVDHVVPVALGGGDTPENLVTACAMCNAGKSSIAPDTPLVENVADDALRWAAAMERAAAIQAADRKKLEDFIAVVDAEWTGWLDDQEFWRPGDWRNSCELFQRAGLTAEEVAGFVAVAMRSRVSEKKLWAYLCGCCWRLIRERQAIAQALIATEDTEE